MTIKTGTVYIVHHVDTEGPLYESLVEIYKRIENVLGIKLPISRTKKNLHKLQNGDIDGFSHEIINQIRKLTNPQLIKLNETWAEIDKMLYEIMSAKFRDSSRDSFGGGWIYNWHIMDHVGFKTNERCRDLGYSKVFDHYTNIIKKTSSKQDSIHWHFHPISFFCEAHIAATSYENSYQEIHQILCRRLIEKHWFPRVNRAGFHTERPDSNWFLEQWVPFDPSNQAIKDKKEQLQKDAINGRFGDWSGAPTNWDMYYPDIYDWRKKGDSNRVVARVLNLNARFRNINDSELEKAFLKAKKGENVYVGVTNHDWRDMGSEIDDFRKMISRVSSKFQNVKYRFSESTHAFRALLNYSEREIKKNSIDFDAVFKNGTLQLKISKGEPFGPQPYLAIKTTKGEYFHDNFDFGEFKKEYFYTFDRYTIPIAKVAKIGLAANDKYGTTCINELDFKLKKVSISKFFIN